MVEAPEELEAKIVIAVVLDGAAAVAVADAAAVAVDQDAGGASIRAPVNVGLRSTDLADRTALVTKIRQANRQNQVDPLPRSLHRLGRQLRRLQRRRACRRRRLPYRRTFNVQC